VGKGALIELSAEKIVRAPCLPATLKQTILPT
jgi:hypothetical protein